MNYDRLTKEYWDSQIERVEELRQKINERPGIVQGRELPDDESLSLGDGKRFLMAVMFIDICGFSARPMETLEEQQLTLRILNLFFTEMIRIAEEYGGQVEKNTGDGLMVYFKDNDGTPPESGVKRAIACAMTMKAATANLINPILRATVNAAEIQFRTSIDYGMVTIARLGAPRRFNGNAAIGTTANFACKMLKHAKADQVVLGENAHRALPSEWQNYTLLLPVDTGFHYSQSKAPYRLFLYHGYWIPFQQ